MVQPSSFGNREEEKFRFFLVRPNELKAGYATIEPLPASVARRDLVACGLPTLGCPP